MNPVFHWVKEHPYIAAAGGVGVFGLVWLAMSYGGSQSNLTPAQQLAMQRLVGNQQIRALRVQTRPQLAATRAGTAQTRIAAGAQNLQTRLSYLLGRQQTANQLTLGKGQLAEETTLANIQASEAQGQLAYEMQQLADQFQLGSSGQQYQYMEFGTQQANQMQWLQTLLDYMGLGPEFAQELQGSGIPMQLPGG